MHNARVRSRHDLLSIALIVIAAIRIALTLTTLAATTDEPVHVTAGVELLEWAKVKQPRI